MKFFLPQIFFGLLTQARNSLAWADGLLNHATGKFAEIADVFLPGDFQRC
jgi:hypothetical protein